MRHPTLWPALFVSILLLAPVGCCPTPNGAALHLAFGDSVTEGKDSPTYPEHLADLLGLAASQVANEGESGESAHGGADRIEELLARCDTYPNAGTLLYLEGAAGLIDWVQETDPLLLWDPLVTPYPFQAALDERLGNIQNNILAALYTAQSAGLATYVATYFELLPNISPCDAFALPFLPPEQAERANHYTLLLNEKIREAAAASGSVLVDIEAELGALNDDPDNFIDCNHPSGSGNLLIAGLFHQALIGP